MTASSWSVVVPVKRLDDAKSRLGLPPDDRAALALAMAVDTLGAVLAAERVARVVVVSGEGRLRAAMRPDERLTWLDDPGAGLDAAIARGRDALVASGAGPAAILLGDLPALRPAELDAALASASEQVRGMVPDAEGVGTTMLTALRAEDLRPHFGLGSRLAHEAAGHVVLDAAGPGLRRDVDTAADLEAAIRLGVGRASAEAIAGLGAESRELLPGRGV